MSFRTYANPIHTWRCDNCSVCFDGNRKTGCVDGRDKGLIKLQEWLTAREYNELPVRPPTPSPENGAGEFIRRPETTATDAVGTYKNRIAEPADSCCPILFMATPQIASSKSAEHSRATGLSTLPL